MRKFTYLLVVLAVSILATNKTPVPRLAPLDPWFPDEFKLYYNAEFARYVLFPGCEGVQKPLQHIPIYYNDGDSVVLPCTVCKITYDEHPEVAKIWRRAKDPKDIFKDSNAKKAEQWIDLKDWVNVNNSKDQFGNFIQRDGQLIIRNISYRAHGLYNCYPQGQRGVAEVIYQLHAMMPPTTNPYVGQHVFDDPYAFDPKTGHKCDPDPEPKLMCRTGEKWNNHSHCERGANPYWHLEYFPHYTSLREEKKFQHDALNLQFVFQWEPWSACSCNRPVLRRREGHCYMKKIRSQSLCSASGSCKIGEDPDAWLEDAFGAWLDKNPNQIRCWSSFVAYYAYATHGIRTNDECDIDNPKATAESFKYETWWYACTEDKWGKHYEDKWRKEPTFLCLDRLGDHDANKTLQDPSYKWLFDFDPLYDKRQDGYHDQPGIPRGAYRGAYTQFLARILKVGGEIAKKSERWNPDRHYDQNPFYYRRPSEGEVTNGLGGQWIQYDYGCDEIDCRRK